MESVALSPSVHSSSTTSFVIAEELNALLGIMSYTEIFLGCPVWIRQCSVFSLWGSSDLPDARVAISPSNKGQIVGKLVVNVTRLWLADRRSHQQCRTEAAPFSYPQEKCYQLPQCCRCFYLHYFPLRDLIAFYLTLDISCETQWVHFQYESIHWVCGRMARANATQIWT